MATKSSKKTSTKSAKTSTKKAAKEPTLSAEEVVHAFANALGLLNDFVASVGGAPTVSKSSKAAAEEPEEVEEEEVFDKEETEALSIKELRALAERLELDEQKKKAGILEEMEEKGYFGESEEEDEEEAEEEEEDEESDEDDEEEEEDEDGEYDRETLEEMTLKEVREIAKEKGISTKGLDQDALVDAILGEDEEEEEDDDEDGEEEETEELDEDALKKMSLKELQSLAKELGIKVPAKDLKAAKSDAKKKKVYVDAILETGEEE